ncbi:MAG: RNA-binding cell elongation regulator Jag/EloR [Acidimicrobiia bacterium]
MEWVETTGRTVADALDSALDELGVHEEDVEVEVLEEPKTGFLGRFGGSDARVRVRLKPISREKPGERRRRKGKGGRSRGEGSGRGDGPGRGDGKPRGESKGRSEGKPRGEGAKSSPGGRGPGSESRSGGRNGRSGRSGESAPKGNEMEESTVPVERQAETATEFTQGLVEAFGADADVSQEIDDGAITVRIDGDDLGLLVGPKGATLNAIEELVRAVVQRETGGHGARIHVDVAGYREKRRQALAEFTRGLVAKVLDSGNDQVLEPMPSPDRKVVHDTVAEIDGVETSSEGEEPRRYVVIRPS